MINRSAIRLERWKEPVETLDILRQKRPNMDTRLLPSLLLRRYCQRNQMGVARDVVKKGSLQGLQEISLS